MDDAIENASVTLNEADGPNTKVSYMYRDGYNYKTANEVVFAGQISPQQVEDLGKALKDRAYVIPGQVGLEDLQDSFMDASEWNPDADHVWHELAEIAYTSKPPTEPQTVAEFVERVKSVTWDDQYKPPFYETMVQRYEQRVRNEEPELVHPTSASMRLRVD
jgi:hypothetical protein